MGSYRLSFVSILTFSVSLINYVCVAQVEYGDGGTHVISSEINDWVDIFNKDSSPLYPTTVNIQTGANITGNNGDGVGVFVVHSSVLNMSGGFVNNHVVGLHESRIRFTGGTIYEDLIADFNATITMTGGRLVNDFVTWDRAFASISGGTIEDDVQAFDNSQIHFSGGVVQDDFETHDSAIAQISGGTIWSDVEAHGGSILISGGSFLGLNLDRGLYANGSANGMLVIAGSNFKIGDTIVGYGDITYNSNDPLSGTLLDGSSFTMNYLLENGGVLRLTDVAAIPEPSTYALILALGALGICHTRRRKNISQKSVEKQPNLRGSDSW